MSDSSQQRGYSRLGSDKAYLNKILNPQSPDYDIDLASRDPNSPLFKLIESLLMRKAQAEIIHDEVIKYFLVVLTTEENIKKYTETIREMKKAEEKQTAFLESSSQQQAKISAQALATTLSDSNKNVAALKILPLEIQVLHQEIKSLKETLAKNQEKQTKFNDNWPTETKKVLKEELTNYFKKSTPPQTIAGFAPDSPAGERIIDAMVTAPSPLQVINTVMTSYEKHQASAVAQPLDPSIPAPPPPPPLTPPSKEHMVAVSGVLAQIKALKQGAIELGCDGIVGLLKPVSKSMTKPAPEPVQDEKEAKLVSAGKSIMQMNPEAIKGISAKTSEAYDLVSEQKNLENKLKTVEHVCKLKEEHLQQIQQHSQEENRASTGLGATPTLRPPGYTK